MKARNDEPLSETEKEQFLYWFFQNIALTESAWLHREQSRIDEGTTKRWCPFYAMWSTTKRAARFDSNGKTALPKLFGLKPWRNAVSKLYRLLIEKTAVVRTGNKFY